MAIHTRITHLNGSAITIVAVYASESLTIHGCDARDGHGTLRHLVAVAAGAVELAKVIDGGVLNTDFSSRVVLATVSFQNIMARA